MIKPFLRASILLSSIFTLMIVLVIVYPYDNSQVGEFMNAEENCDGICLLGIQPGKTSVGEAMLKLQNHPWVSDVQQNAAGNGFALISWGWSGQQPRVVDQSRRGRVTFYWVEEDVIQLLDTVVETITIYTDIRIYSLQNWLGQTDNGAATLRPDGKLGYSVIYDIAGGILNLYVELPCPFTMMNYWNARTRLTISIGRREGGYIDFMDLADVCG